MKTSAAQFHSFNVELAAKFGVHEAILIHHFQYWINHNKALRRNEHDGRTWTYQTRQEIAAWFPYLSHKQVERLTDKLVAVGVLRKGNFAKNQHNRALWYAFEDEEVYVTSSRHFPKSGNGNDEIGKCTLDTDTVTEAAAAAAASPQGVAQHDHSEPSESRAPQATVSAQGETASDSEPLGEVPPRSNNYCVGNVHNPMPKGWEWVASELDPDSWGHAERALLIAVRKFGTLNSATCQAAYLAQKQEGIKKSPLALFKWLLSASDGRPTYEDMVVATRDPGASERPSEAPVWLSMARSILKDALGDRIFIGDSHLTLFEPTGPYGILEPSRHIRFIKSTDVQHLFMFVNKHTNLNLTFPSEELTNEKN